MKVAPEQNIIRNRLDLILGSKGAVRVLRVLTRYVGTTMTAGRIAEQTGLTAVGTRKLLAQLVRSGFVDRIGEGKSRQYTVRATDPLAPALKALFATELSVHDSFIAQLKSTFSEVPEVHAAWISSLPTTLGESVDVIAVVEAKSVPWIRQELRTRLSSLEHEFDQVIELSIHTRAEDLGSPPRDGILLAGFAAGQVAQVSDAPSSTKTGHEKRALHWSRRIAELIQEDPSIIRRATSHIDRLLLEPQGTATPDLLEWRQLLASYSPERLKDFLVSEASRARRLRQSSPFYAVLTPDQRDRLLSS